MSIDAFLSRTYRGESFKCARLAIDVWKHLTGRDAGPVLAGFLVPGRDMVRLARPRGVRMLQAPENPCFVLMRSATREPHVGVFHRGKIVHFAGNRVEYQPPEVVTFGYSRIRYFTC